ncbi:MAG: hypothetical protein JXB03_04545 [Spirochaetales bacterium]|nr:hypothetical protein [Spirochaetales bacterium]
MEIQPRTYKDLKALLSDCITRLGQTEGKRYFSLLLSKTENDLLNELEALPDILLDVESRMPPSKDTLTDLEELPVVTEQDEYIAVLESV